jgi:hypothetical protein
MISAGNKNCNKGRGMVLLATGPTLDKFDITLLPKKKVRDGVISWQRLLQVGVNSILYNDKYNLDYYFCAHNVAREGENHPHADIETNTPQLKKIQELSEKTRIFCGDPRDFSDGFTQSEVFSFHGTTFRCNAAAEFRTDVPQASREGLYNHLIPLPALQVMLYTGVSEIYLVGCDCGGQSSYLTEPSVKWKDSTQTSVLHWNIFKDYVSAEYPDVKIISVNPVALKGVFDEDIYHG